MLVRSCNTQPSMYDVDKKGMNLGKVKPEKIRINIVSKQTKITKVSNFLIVIHTLFIFYVVGAASAIPVTVDVASIPFSATIPAATQLPPVMKKV